MNQQMWQAAATQENLATLARRGVEIIGDIPLYAANDSADVWSRPDLFAIDPDSAFS